MHPEDAEEDEDHDTTFQSMSERLQSLIQNGTEALASPKSVFSSESQDSEEHDQPLPTLPDIDFKAPNFGPSASDRRRSMPSLIPNLKNSPEKKLGHRHRPSYG